MARSRFALLGSQIGGGLGQGFAGGMQQGQQLRQALQLAALKQQMEPSIAAKMLEEAEGFGSLTPEQQQNLRAYRMLGQVGQPNPLAQLAGLLGMFGMGGAMQQQPPVTTGTPTSTTPPPVTGQPSWQGTYELEGQGYKPQTKAQADKLIAAGATKVQ